MGQSESHDPNLYYVPHGSRWPIVASLALFTTMLGAAMSLNHSAGGNVLLIGGVLALVGMLFGWFGDVIRESVQGFYNRQVDISFRMGMIWFIFSEVMFFAAFFGALFYARMFSVPWLGGDGDGALTHEYLWQGYSAAWPTNGPLKVGGAFETIGAWGLPFLNTLLLLSSGLTVTVAHHALRAGARGRLLVFLGAWNDFMWPLIVLSDRDLQTLPVALAGLSREHVQDTELMMAGSVLTVMPVLVLFLVLQKHYMKGLLMGSVK